MTTTTATRTTTTARTTTGPARKTAIVAGALYLLTFVSIPTLTLYGPVHDPGYLLGPGPDTPVVIGAVLEMIVAFACIGTAVALYPVVKRHNEALALGFVAARTLEAATIVAGVVSLLTVVTLRQAQAGPAALVTGRALVASYDWSFQLGQSLMPVLNAMLLGTLLYRSRLVPRVLPLLGFVGAPLLLASDVAVLFGVWDRMSGPAAIAALPIAVWEFSLGIYLLVKGFRTSTIPTTTTPTVAQYSSSRI